MPSVAKWKQSPKACPLRICLAPCQFEKAICVCERFFIYSEEKIITWVMSTAYTPLVIIGLVCERREYGIGRPPWSIEFNHQVHHTTCFPSNRVFGVRLQVAGKDQFENVVEELKQSPSLHSSHPKNLLLARSGLSTPRFSLGGLFHSWSPLSRNQSATVRNFSCTSASVDTLCWLAKSSHRSG